MYQHCRDVGVGLRAAHLHHVVNTKPSVAWFEVHICNFLGGGLNRALLQQVGEYYPLSFHSVNMNLGGVDALDYEYLNKLKTAIDFFQPSLVSGHCCFTRHQTHHFHDLLPIPFTDEAVMHVAKRIETVQDVLGRRILIENISRYENYAESQMSEAMFLSAVCEQVDCGVILDLNNAYVNFVNLNESVDEFITALPLDRIEEIHLAGHSQVEGQLLDTHNCAVSDNVWQLLARYQSLLSGVPCLIEWDNDLPKFPELLAERDKAIEIYRDATHADKQLTLDNDG